MSVPAKLVLVRHGMTLWNQQRRLQGWLDSPLTEQAMEQLAALTLPPLSKPIIYCSDLRRSLDSAAILARRLNCDMVSDTRLRERYFGPLEGEVMDADPNLSHHWAAYHHRYIAPIDSALGIESELDFERRIQSFMADLLGDGLERDTLLVGHGEWLRALDNMLHNRPSSQQGKGVTANGAPLIIDDFNLSQ